MIQFTLSVFKYSFLVLAILILSHIIQIQGITISKHVENGMDRISGINPTTQIHRLKSTITSDIQTHVNQIEKATEK